VYDYNDFSIGVLLPLIYTVSRASIGALGSTSLMHHTCTESYIP